MIPKYEDYRKTHGSGFAKGTLSRSEYTKVLKGTNDFPSQEVKKIIAEVEVKLAQKRAKEIKKQGSPSEIHKVQPQKTKSKPLKAGNTPSKKANAKKNDDMIPRSEYLKLRFKINELSECYRNDKLKLLKLTSDLWKASGRNFSGEDFQKFEEKLQAFNIDTRLEDFTTTHSTVPLIVPTSISVTVTADVAGNAVTSRGVPLIPSHIANAAAVVASNPATLGDLISNSITNTDDTTDSADSLPTLSAADATTIIMEPGASAVEIISSDTNASSMNPSIQENGGGAAAAADNSALGRTCRKRSNTSTESASKRRAWLVLPLAEARFKLFDTESDEYQRLIYEDSPWITPPPFFEY